MGFTLLNPSVPNPFVVSLTNNESGAIVCGAPVYMQAAGAVKKAKADAAATQNVIGLALTTSIAAAASGAVVLAGPVTLTTAQWDAITGQSGGLTFDATYFLDPATAGKLTTTAPTTATQYVKPIGVALSSTVLNLSIQKSVLL